MGHGTVSLYIPAGFDQERALLEALPKGVRGRLVGELLRSDRARKDGVGVYDSLIAEYQERADLLRKLRDGLEAELAEAAKRKEATQRALGAVSGDKAQGAEAPKDELPVELRTIFADFERFRLKAPRREMPDPYAGLEGWLGGRFAVELKVLNMTALELAEALERRYRKNDTAPQAAAPPSIAPALKAAPGPKGV